MVVQLQLERLLERLIPSTVCINIFNMLFFLCCCRVCFQRLFAQSPVLGFLMLPWSLGRWNLKWNRQSLFWICFGCIQKWQAASMLEVMSASKFFTLFLLTPHTHSSAPPNHAHGKPQHGSTTKSPHAKWYQHAQFHMHKYKNPKVQTRTEPGRWCTRGTKRRICQKNGCLWQAGGGLERKGSSASRILD